MVRYLIGLVFGVAFCGTVLAALALLNPLERDDGAAAPAQEVAPETPDARVQPATAPQQDPEPEAAQAPAPGAAPEAAPAPGSVPVPVPGGAPSGQDGASAAPERRPQGDAAQAAIPRPSVPWVDSIAASGGEPAGTQPPAAEHAPVVAADDSTSEPQPGEDAVMAADDRPAADATPMVATAEGAGGTPVTGDAGPMAFTAGPEVGGGVALGAPSIGGDSASISAAGSDRPIRMAAAPQQVTAGSTDTGAKPAVDTESAAMPEIGGSELEDEETPLGPPPELQAGAALADNAAVFSGDSSRPLMSIILIDTGENPALRAGLTALTAPITFGVEADIPDADEIAANYRNAGFEVAAVLPGTGRLGLVKGLPEDSVEPLLARVFDRVPVAATLMDPIDGPLPRDRRMANAVLDALAVSGHGLLTYRGNGLNNVPIIAGEKGVPSELVYRVIDEEPGVANINLALERAVLDASRSGHVIVVGRVRQETVTTLFSWLLGSGAREVTIAPASAVLRDTQS